MVPCVFTGLGLTTEDMPQYADPGIMKAKFTEIFLTKTRDEWTRIFEKLDACCEPILEHDEAVQDPHNVAIETFITNSDGDAEPGPAPKLTRTPGVRTLPRRPLLGEHTETVLANQGFTKKEITHLLEIGAVFQNTQNFSKL